MAATNMFLLPICFEVCTNIFLTEIKLIANGWAWRWCLPKWASIPRQAMSLEPQAMSRAHRPPRQLCERPPPTRHRHTDWVSGDTYQIHQRGREGKGEEAEQLNACCLKQTAPHTAEMTSTCDSRKPRMSPQCAWFPDCRWTALAWI